MNEPCPSPMLKILSRLLNYDAPKPCFCTTLQHVRRRFFFPFVFSSEFLLRIFCVHVFALASARSFVNFYIREGLVLPGYSPLAIVARWSGCIVRTMSLHTMPDFARWNRAENLPYLQRRCARSSEMIGSETGVHKLRRKLVSLELLWWKISTTLSFDLNNQIGVYEGTIPNWIRKSQFDFLIIASTRMSSIVILTECAQWIVRVEYFHWSASALLSVHILIQQVQ